MRKNNLSRRFHGRYYITKREHRGMSFEDRLKDACSRAHDPGRVRIAKVDKSSREKEM